MAYEDTEDYKNLMKAQARERANFVEPGMESTAEFMKRTGTKAKPPKATVGAPKVVTKEQMKKAGFDNLRDYLNAQKGLKRRDGFASEAQKRAYAASPRGTQTEGSQGEAEARAIAEMRRKASMPSSKEDSERDAREKDVSGPLKKTPDAKKEVSSKPSTSKGSFTNTGYKEYERIRQEGRERRAAAMADKNAGFKKGGMVSASKRADGCATRGKTRGKMV